MSLKLAAKLSDTVENVQMNSIKIQHLTSFNLNDLKIPKW